jgi:hypothetical protein
MRELLFPLTWPRRQGSESATDVGRTVRVGNGVGTSVGVGGAVGSGTGADSASGSGADSLKTAATLATSSVARAADEGLGITVLVGDGCGLGLTCVKAALNAST